MPESDKIASIVSDIEQEKRRAAEAAASLVEHGMTVGLGTGSTVAYLLPALAARALDIRCVATSPRTQSAARNLGLHVRPFHGISRLDIAIDGADQVAPDKWLIKGGGGAHTREKVVASAAERFVVIVSSDKLVERLTPPVPLEILAFGVDATLRALPSASIRRAAPASPDGGVIADWNAEFDDPATLACYFAAIAGIVDHGLFSPSLVSDVVIARGDQVEHRT
jgi:ribose 5-phosphate isomerase A